MTITTQKTSESRWDRIRARLQRIAEWLFTVRKVGFGLLAMSVSVGFYGHISSYGTLNWNQFFQDFYANISSELGSVAITVLIIDSLYQRRQREEEKARLIRQMSSKENGLALQAAEELRALGAVKDGALRGANLEGANLEGVRLGRADLRDARMDFSNLSQSYMYFANLERADMSGVNFQGAVLTGANLRNADLVTAKLHGTLLSEADLTHAKLDHAEFDEQTQLPDKTTWAKGADLSRFTDPNHPNYWRSAMSESPAYKGKK